MSNAALADPETGTLDDLIDLGRCPIDRPHSDHWRHVVGQARADLADVGLAQIDGFLRPAALAALRDELELLRPHVTVTSDERTAYSADPLTDPAAPTSAWVAGHATRDMFPPHSVAHRVYVAPDFKRFIAACVGHARVFEYADPLAGLVATVLPDGGQYGWHYDTNEFVVTISISPAQRGGDFEFVPDLRTPGDENLEGLRRVLFGQRDKVQTADCAAGSLQLFLGRYALHRVTEVSGSDRLTLVLSYADRPGIIGPLDRTRRVYGRVTEAHLLAASAPTGADGLVL